MNINFSDVNNCLCVFNLFKVKVNKFLNFDKLLILF